MSFVVAQDGRYQITDGAGTRCISLSNLERRLDGGESDYGRVSSFIDQAIPVPELPTWNSARTTIFWSAEPSDSEFGDTIRAEVTETVTSVLVVTTADRGLVTWITPRHLSEWGVSIDEVRHTAGANLDQMLAVGGLEVGDIGELKVGMVPIDSPLKASVIFAPSFHGYVQEIGWPVLALVPCRDFIYILSERDAQHLARFGEVVQREYRQSPYPITTEVLRVGPSGIDAVGRFPE